MDKDNKYTPSRTAIFGSKILYDVRSKYIQVQDLLVKAISTHPIHTFISYISVGPRYGVRRTGKSFLGPRYDKTSTISLILYSYKLLLDYIIVLGVDNKYLNYGLRLFV